MLIAHLEQEGVWRLPGGMQSLARGLAETALDRGAALYCNERVQRIEERGIL